MKPDEITGEDPINCARLYDVPEDDIRKQMVEEYNISRKGSCLTSLILAQDVRKKLGLTQPALASLLAIPVATLQSWEQNPFLMGPAAQILLMLLDREPEPAQRALRALRLDPRGPRYPMSDYGIYPAPVRKPGHE
jgi:DNA-binding transcriptional regulator YiaG